MDHQALANRLGAFALALADRQAAVVQAKLGLAPTRAAALVSVGADPGIAATALARVLGVTQSVAARLSDDLMRLGWLEKRGGRTGRDLALHLTQTGQALRGKILAARHEAVQELLATLPIAAQTTLATQIDALLGALSVDRRGADHLCRLCDEAACGLAACPVELCVAER